MKTNLIFILPVSTSFIFNLNHERRNMNVCGKSYLRIVIVSIAMVLVCAQSGLSFESNNLVSDTIIIGSEPDYPPYCLVDKDGQADGFSVELFKAAAHAAGLTVVVRIGVWSQIMQSLANEEIDALPLVGRTPERESLFDFTMPYMSLHGAVFVRKNEDVVIRSIDDLKNKHLVVMKGDNAEEFVRRENISEHVFTTNTFEEAFIQLANGEHDAVITQRVVGLNLLKELNIQSVEPLDLQLPHFRQDFCFAVKKGNQSLLARLNEGLSIVIADGTYEQIRYEWFGPILKEKLSSKDILRIVLIVFIPLVILVSILWIIFLRREVRRRTRTLNEEIVTRKQSESELLKLKDRLEALVTLRTRELQEKVQKLDKSQKEMSLLVDDLNRIATDLKIERHKLELSNKELEAFTYSVSHDLRAPLRTINGFSKFLLEDYSDQLDDDAKRFIHIIRDNATKMDQLISELLNLSRVSKADMRLTKVDLSAIAASMFQEVASEEEKKMFEVTINNMPTVRCDAILIKQVWQNLIGNALKYSSKSEVKKIEIGCVEETASDVECGNEVCCYIKDHGAGFNPKYKSKLFEVFQRLHSSNEFEGTGVGLAIVQRIIHRHGGRVWAEGMVHKGATFYFSLPK